MTDRLTLIMELGALATDAAQRGDDRAAATLRDAAELLFTDKRIDKLRATDRRRKVDSTGIQRIPPESSGFHGIPAPAGTPARVRAEEEEEEEKRALATADPMYEINRGLVDQTMGEHFPIAKHFVEKRAPVTWAAWYGAIQSALVGGQALPIDLAQVLSDDGALDRPIGTPKGLRAFVASAVEERKFGVTRRPPFGAGARAVPGARRDNPGNPNTPRTLAATEMLIGEGAND